MKKYLLGIITGLFIASVVVGAAIIYHANEIGFTPSDKTWNVSTVEDALNDINNRYSSNISNNELNISVSKVASSSVVFKVNDDNNAFNNVNVYVNGEFYKNYTDKTIYVENLTKLTEYNFLFTSVDNEGKYAKEELSVTLNDEIIMDQDYANGGILYKGVYTTYNDSLGINLTGASELSYTVAFDTRFNTMPKWYKTIDLTNINKITFKARKGANHGNVFVAIDNTLLMDYSYSTLDTLWHDYEIDLSSYTGEHVVSFAGGYSDNTGYTSSNTQYSNIIFK